MGIPSWLRESTDPSPGRNYFFMHIAPASAAKSSKEAKTQAQADASQAVAAGVLSDHMPVKGDVQGALVKESGVAFAPRLLLHKSPIPDLVLGPLLGKGGYGKVFRGLHKGQEVAVKVRTAHGVVV